MIFLTVGTQQPFDRLVAAVDDWAAAHPEVEVFGQVAEPGPSGHRPANFGWVSRLEPEQFRARFAAAEAIVSHAGMGTIITALSLGKPVVLLPRRARLREQRNDHQLATVERWRSRPGIHVAMEADEVAGLLDRVLSQPPAGAGTGGIGEASEELVTALRDLVHGHETD